MLIRGLKQDIYTCNRCKCGFCREECPSYKTFGLESYSGRGRMSIAWAVLEGKLDLTNELAERIYTCTMCRYCSARCSMDITAIIKAFREELVERGLVPPEVRDFLENTHKYGNPWKEPREKRGEWTEGKEIRQYESGDEFLYYVGCVGSYDTRGNKVAKALGEILLESGLSFGVLGSDENCDGNEVNMLGEKGLFQLLVEKNIRKFKKLGVKKIVTLSPHSYNVMKNEYPQHGGNFEVMHYTKLLREVIGSGKLGISKGLNARVTYHDPCFLGRYNEEYDAPRDILRDIPGIELVEMERNRENSFCCGGGGGNFYTDFFGGREDSPSRIRVREAYNTGAEILAVACPTCMTMLDDAVKVEGLEEKLTIRDISEIVKAAMEGTS
ncbi:MAG: (Fe-S)-binding protein [Candidatus Bathyarchaeia archaeon]